VPGPVPKHPSQRRRRNTGPQFKTLPAEGRKEPVPELPERPGGWLPSTRDWWRRIWKSPMATEWIEADHDTLLRLAYMVDAEARGQGGTVLYREIRLLESSFGLNPASRVRLRWEIGPEGGADVQRPSDSRQLRAVDRRPPPPRRKERPKRRSVNRFNGPEWSAGEGLGAEAAPRHEGGQGEIDQVAHDRHRLTTPEAHDHRANKQQHRAGSSQRHQNRRDV
jgi:hypothetical protein